VCTLVLVLVLVLVCGSGCVGVCVCRLVGVEGGNAVGLGGLRQYLNSSERTWNRRAMRQRYSASAPCSSLDAVQVQSLLLAPLFVQLQIQ
jgi:hypothetical protein